MNNRRKGVTLLIIVLWTFILPANSTTVNITANRDTYIESWQPTTNHGTDTTLWLGRNESRSTYNDALIGFNLSSIPTGATINSAVVYMYETTGGSTGYVESIYKITSPWDGYTVTWSTKPTFDSEAITSSNGLESKGWQSWNVTTTVASFFGGGVINNGFLLRETSSGTLFSVYSSRESGGYAPYITITYTSKKNDAINTLQKYDINHNGFIDIKELLKADIDLKKNHLTNREFEFIKVAYKNKIRFPIK